MNVLFAFLSVLYKDVYCIPGP